MRDYLLFIDTEASGLPRKWNVNYADQRNWPYIMQLSWLVYDCQGRELKRQDHYINNRDFSCSAGAFNIHGITEEFRYSAGKPRQEALKALSDDLNRYQPMIIGHFTELDLHLIGADYFRAEMENPALELPAFCTMLASKHYVRNPQASFLRLGELYATLFGRKLEKPHNALEDAKATAECFFELLKRGDITEEKIEKQQPEMHKVMGESRRFGLGLPVLMLFLLTALLAYLI